MQIFEVDQPGPQAWKKKRLAETGFALPSWLHFVPVDFEKQSWWERLLASGFEAKKPAFVVSTGVSMYLTKDANMATLRQMAQLAPGSTFTMTFMLALDLLPPPERATMEFVMKRAAESGTPFLSLFPPPEMLAMAKDAGFKRAEYVSAADIFQRYFAQRSDGLNAGTAEAFLVAGT
jgi:methyltransferase (TIGR00027 family)